ncbi:hypothetical protein I7V28_01560 [Lelliottia amnigena]|uniref:hypothetical protein n=1 Tax=Lelliottia amnigena TaxID=61646 RepID=UPI00192CA1C1|nr:hypothetical protein [Lelliottia amnigena]MBL5919821.1 hypothetical protein [Lelliottia amnigena]
MVSTQVKFVVVGHHKRIDAAKGLCGILDAHMLIDYEDHGANWNHRRALEWANEQGCHVVVLEDDALPVEGFISSVYDWIERYPDSLISFYLGTGRPPQYQLEIASKLIAADKSRAEFIMLTRLIHGVCYCVPPKHIQKVLDKWSHSKAADYAVGDAHGGPVIYPCYSLVDHADGQPVEPARDKQPRTERRKAWRLYG